MTTTKPMTTKPRIARVAIYDETGEFDLIYGQDLLSFTTQYHVTFIEWDPDEIDPAEEVALMTPAQTQEGF